MGYIPNTDRTLTGYLTQKGREYLVAGDKDGFTIEFFALGDPDVDYMAASQPGDGTPYNMLGAGFIPDLSGDDNGAIKSLSGGVTQRYFLSGGTNVKQLGTDLTLGGARNVVRFSDTQQQVNLSKSSTGSQQQLFNFGIEVLGRATVGLERVKIYLLPPSQGTSPELYATLSADANNGGIYQWGAGSPFTQQGTGVWNIPVSNSGTFNYVAKFKMVPFKSAITIDPDRNILTVNLSLSVRGSSGSSSSSIGFSA